MNSVDKLDKLYSKSGFINKYGGSIIITTLILLSFSALTAYFYITANLKELRKDWVEKRCHPQYMPFASIIHPEKDKSAFDTTANNFQYCMNGILGEISEYESEPIHYMIMALHSVMGTITGAVQAVRMLVKEVIDSIIKIFDEIYNKIEAVLVPIRLIFLKNKDIMHRTQGVLITVLYGVFAGYQALRSFVGAFIELVIVLLIAMAIVIISLFALLFGIPEAIALAIVFATIAGFITPVIIWAEQAISVSSNKKVPKKPGCFNPNTRYTVYQRGWLSKSKRKRVKLKYIQPGTRVAHSNNHPQIITATMKMRGGNVYNINGIKVSEKHPIVWTTALREIARERNNKRADTLELSRIQLNKSLEIGQAYPANVIARAFYGVNYHKYRERLKELTCLSTTSKYLEFDGLKARDWDELDLSDIGILKAFITQKYINHNLSLETLSWIHRYLEYGLHGDTRITTSSNTTKKISKLRVGEYLTYPLVKSVELSNGDYDYEQKYIEDQVIGIVKIETSLIDKIYQYKWVDVWNDKLIEKCWIGSPNCMRYVRPNEIFSSQKLPAYFAKFDSTFTWVNGFEKYDFKRPRYLYNIITRSGLMMANGVLMYDYNGGLDNILGECKLHIPDGC
jgi:hypothetical protein